MVVIRGKFAHFEIVVEKKKRGKLGEKLKRRFIGVKLFVFFY